jgi:hypothetical protein
VKPLGVAAGFAGKPMVPKSCGAGNGAGGKTDREVDMTNRQRMVLAGMASAAALAVVACATQPHPAHLDSSQPPGFWLGLAHGFLMLFSFIASFFMDVRIYNYPNAGGWYDFGFLVGAMLFWGGGGASSKRR